MPGVTLPLEGLRVLEYAQYVAGPFAGMLLADLGADVVKVESPTGDAWRHYEPFDAGESRYFYALNRNKRSVVLDLKTDAGLRASRALLAGADAVLHNFPPERAARYGLDRESVRALNPRAAWCVVSALGTDGPEAELTAFDLVAQALSGLLLAGARPGDEIPRRAGGIAMADFTAGLLAAVSLLAGLVGRREAAPGVEVSLLGAALAVQAQRFVSVEALDGDGRRARAAGRELATAGDLAAHGARVRASEELEPYYRAYRAADGFFVLTCLNEGQRRTTLGLLGMEDPFVADPQAVPASEPERAARTRLVRRFEAILAREPAAHWIRRLRAAGVPAAEVRTLDQLYEDPQALANGLVQEVDAPAGDAVRLLGGVFKVDGAAAGARRGVPALGEHTGEVLAALGIEAPSEAVTSAAPRGRANAGAGGMKDEAAAFAEAVGVAADRMLAEPEPWQPGAVQDDRCRELSHALAGMGWLDVGRDPELLPLAGPAALELGRRLAPLSELDALLGGSPLAGDLVRHCAAKAVAVDAHGVAVVFAIDRAEPVAYGDALGVHRVLDRHELGRAPQAAVDAWTAATTGYLAGLSEWALGVALEYAKERKAFGATLAALAPVQQRLADAATAARGLRLLAHDSPGRAALAHAGPAAVGVTAACQQVVGAIGFTLEFPLQRAYRRARAVQLWADALIAPSR